MISNVERHEFIAWKYQPIGQEPIEIHRVALGNLILAQNRQEMPPTWGHPEYNSLCGSVGFMDLIKREERVPKLGAIPVILDFYSPLDCESLRALVIQNIAIEPTYREKGYCGFLLQRAEEIARECMQEVLVADMIINPIMKEYLRRLGYRSYYEGLKAVKRLA